MNLTRKNLTIKVTNFFKNDEISWFRQTALERYNWCLKTFNTKNGACRTVYFFCKFHFLPKFEKKVWNNFCNLLWENNNIVLQTSDMKSMNCDSYSVIYWTKKSYLNSILQIILIINGVFSVLFLLLIQKLFLLVFFAGFSLD